MSRLDLHLHSNFSSDGEFSPAALLSLCEQAGVTVAAIADHNSVRGIAPARACAADYGVTLLSAVELDCVHEGVNLHLLGYCFDETDPAFARAEAHILALEQAAAAERLQRVRQLGIAVDDDALARLTGDGVYTAERIAEVALAQPENNASPLLAPYRAGGNRSDAPLVNFYWDFCAQGKPAYVPMEFPSLRDSVALVRAAGGVPILAHPGNNLNRDNALLASVIAEGVAGLEVYSSYHSTAQTAFYRYYAHAAGLLFTCGSDFHGKIKPNISIGAVECDGREDKLLAALQKSL